MIITYTYTHIHLRQLILQFSSYSKTYFNASKLIPVSYGWEKGEGMQYCGVACWCLQHAPLMTAQCTCHMICNYICMHTCIPTCEHVRMNDCLYVRISAYQFFSMYGSFSPFHSPDVNIYVHTFQCVRDRGCVCVCVCLWSQVVCASAC